MSEAPPITPKEFAEAAEVTSGFASLVLRGLKPMPLRAAIKVFRKTNRKLGPIADVPDHEIDILEKHEAR